MNGRIGTKFWVISCDTCSYPGCFRKVVALNIMVARGGFCLEHVPKTWIDEMDFNEHLLFGSPLTKSVTFQAGELERRDNELNQQEINALMDLMTVPADKKD